MNRKFFLQPIIKVMETQVKKTDFKIVRLIRWFGLMIMEPD